MRGLIYTSEQQGGHLEGWRVLHIQKKQERGDGVEMCCKGAPSVVLRRIAVMMTMMMMIAMTV